MLVAVHRLYRKGSLRERSVKPLRIIETDSLDHAIEIFERDFRYKYPEHWGYEYEEDPLLKELLELV